MEPSAAEPSGRRSRWRRRLGYAFAALCAVLLLVLVAVVVLLRSLDHPRVKAWVQGLVRSEVGLALDYQSAQASLWSGLTVHDITVQTPAALATLAPQLLKVGVVEVKWGLGRLLASTERIDSIAVRDVELVVIFDAAGRSSFDFEPTTPAPPSGNAPPRPLSRLLDDLLLTPLPVRNIEIDPIRTTVLRSSAGVVQETIRVHGVRALARTGAAKRGAKVALELGTKEQPLDLVIERQAPAAAQTVRAKWWLLAEAEPGVASVALAMRLVEQSVAPELKVDSVVALTAAARFDEKGQRVVVTIPELAIGDGALHATAEVEQPDAASALPKIVKLEGTLDVDRMLALIPRVWLAQLPAIGGGKLAIGVEQLQLGAVPYLLADGKLRATGTITKVRYARDNVAAEVPVVKLDLTAGADKSLHGGVELELDGAKWTAAKKGGAEVSAGSGKVGIKCAHLRLGPKLATGKLHVTVALDKLAAKSGTLTVGVDGFSLDVSGDLVEQPPYAARVVLGAEQLHLRRGERRLLDEPFSLELDLRHVVPMLLRPIASQATAKLDAKLGTSTLSLDAKKRAESIEYTMAIDAPSLAVVAPLLGETPGLVVPWPRVGLKLRSKGAATGLDSELQIRHESSVALDHPVITSRAGKLAMALLQTDFKSSGSLRRHDGEMVLAFTELSRDGNRLGDGTLTSRVKLDLAAPSAHVSLTSSGSATPVLDADIDIGFSRGKRLLTFDAKLKADKLVPAAPLFAAWPQLHGFALPGLAFAVEAKGSLAGFVESVGADGTPVFAADPIGKLSGGAQLGVVIAGLKWHKGDRSIETPKLTWKGTLRAEGEQRTLESDLDVDEVHFAFGPQRLDLAQLRDDLAVTLTGDPKLGQIELRDKMSLQALRQEVAPYYPTGNLELSIEAKRNKDGVIRIPRMSIHNAAGGTTLKLRGGIDLGEDRRSLSLRGSLDQDLAKVWTDKQRFVGRGTLATDVQINSGDLKLYRTASSVKITDGHLELPAQKIKLDTVDGLIPIVADVLFTRQGPKLVREGGDNSYTEVRFVDQHPLGSRHSYLTIGKIETPWANIAPLAGNLEIKHNTFSMSQLELGVRNGRVSGRCSVEWKGRDSQIQLAIRASGVQSSRGEPFDGNSAMDVSVRQHSVQGRAEILRIGRRHLLDLLDVVDPPRTDAAINKVRRALALGYPDQVRIAFNRGFASARITFGGVASLVRLDEIRGIPMGPIIDRALAPFLDNGEEE